MKRREFTMGMVGVTATALAGTAAAQAYAEGRNYVRLSTPVPTSLPADAPGKKIEVIEFFSYSCPHCFHFDPAVEAWEKKLAPDVYFQRVPVGFGGMFAATQKLFYALQNLGVRESLHRKVFTTIHVQGNRLVTEKDQIAFAVANGIEEAKFTDALKSFQLATQCRRAEQLTAAYKVESVPALGVNGRFFTNGQLANAGAPGGANEAALDVVNFLVDRIRKGG